MTIPHLWRSLRKRRVLRLSGMRTASLLLQVMAAIVLIAFLVPLWVLPPKRSVAVSATTQKISITLAGANRWLMRDAVLCDAYDQTCTQKTGKPISRADITWQHCDRITILAGADPDTFVFVLPSGLFDMDEPILYMDRAAFEENGAQSFSGFLEIGGSAASGGGVLLTGDYGFYDRDTLSIFFDRSPGIVKTGAFRHGDAVSLIATSGSTSAAQRGECADVGVVDDTNWIPQLVFGHFSLPASTDERGFAVTATSAAAEVGLQVTRLGLEKPLIIRPGWTDVVIASPAFLAVTILLTYLATVIQLIGSSDEKQPADRKGWKTPGVRWPPAPRPSPRLTRRKAKRRER